MAFDDDGDAERQIAAEGDDGDDLEGIIDFEVSRAERRGGSL